VVVIARGYPDRDDVVGVVCPKWFGQVNRGNPPRMFVGDVIAKILRFARAGYPTGVPTTDTFAVLAVLPRRAAELEVGRNTSGTGR
jgi:hypothetical protein